MNEHIRERILRKLDALSDERGYQLLDYVEFLESRYAERQTPGATPFTRFAEAVEDRLRAGKVSAATIAEAMNMMNRAANVLNGALAAGRSVANDIVTATRTGGTATAGGPSGAAGQSTTGETARASTSGSHPAVSSARGSTTSAGTDSASSDDPGTRNAGAAPVGASSPAHNTQMPGSGEEKL